MFTDLGSQVSDSKSDKVPEWVKNNAAWWAQGAISDKEFVGGVFGGVLGQPFLQKALVVIQFEEEVIRIFLYRRTQQPVPTSRTKRQQFTHQGQPEPGGNRFGRHQKN